MTRAHVLTFDVELFQEKWFRMSELEPDDWLGIPATASGFAWEGIEDGLIPWAAMNLNADFWPEYRMVWEKRVKWKAISAEQTPHPAQTPSKIHLAICLLD